MVLGDRTLGMRPISECQGWRTEVHLLLRTHGILGAKELVRAATMEWCPGIRPYITLSAWGTTGTALVSSSGRCGNRPRLSIRCGVISQSTVRRR